MKKDSLKEVKHYKSKSLPNTPVPDAVLYIKADTDTEVTTYITDVNGVPYLLKDDGNIVNTGVQTVFNTDGTISVIGTENVKVSLQSDLVDLINSSLQPGDNVSELLNDGDGVSPFVTQVDLDNIVIPDATTTTKGIIKLANDLGGTADLPTTPTALHKTGDEIKDGDLILNDNLILTDLAAPVGTLGNLGIDDTGIVTNIPIETASSGNVQIVATNKTGVTISRGSVVYISGAQGSKATIALALADTNVNTSSAIGIVSANIADNASGYVTILGEITGLNTSSFINGDKVYVSPTIPGGLTTVIPTSPDNVVFVGTVTNSHSTQGKIIVNLLYTSKLDRLVDVAILSPSDNNILTFDSVSGLWKNETVVSALGYIPENTGNKGTPLGYASLGADGYTLLSETNPSALERLVIVADQTARFALTTTTVQNGDTVKQADTNVMYYVKDDTNLSNSNGYELYRAGTAASVPWTGVTGTPTSISGYGIIPAIGDYTTALVPDTVNARYQTDNQKLYNDATSSIQTQLNSKVATTRLLNINGVSQDLSLDREWITAQSDTGVKLFSGLTTNSATTINVGTVTGIIVDNETNPLIPTHTKIVYAGATNVTVTTIGSGTESFVMMGSDGLGGGIVSFQNTFPTSAERKAKIFLGKISHPSGTVVVAINEPDYITSPMAFSRDMFQRIAYINDNVYPYANGVNLNINITGGSIGGDGINFVNDRTRPNDITVLPGVAQAFVYRTQLGGATGAVTAISPGFYDVGGVVTPVGGGANSSTLQYIYIIPGQGYIIQYGQTVYSTLTSAISSVGRESLTVYPNLVKNSLLIGVLAVNKSATQLNDTTQAQFFKADIFGQIIGATAGTTVGTLQTAYNNSLVPQIVTTAGLGALTVKQGSGLDTDSVFIGQNGAGVNTSTINGNGLFTGSVENHSLVTGATDEDALNTLNTDKLGGSGTVNTLPLFTASKTLGNSIISQSSTSIGISTLTPQATLHLADANAIYVDRYQNGNVLLKPNMFLRNFGGTFASPLALPVDAPIGAFAFSAGYTTSSTTGQPPNAQIQGFAKGSQSPTAHGGQLQLQVTRPETLLSETILDLQADSAKLVPEDNDAIATVGLLAPQVGLEGSHKLQVVSRAGHPTVSFGNYGANAGFHGWSSRGTYAAPTKLLSGDALFSFGFRGWGDTGLQGSSGSLTVYATEDFTDTAQGTRVIIQTNANGHNATALGRTSTFEFGQDGTFSVPGKLGIGVTVPNYMMHSHAATGSNYHQFTTAITGTTTGDGLLLGNDTSGNVHIWNRENTPISFFTNNTEKVRLHASGGLSVGNTTDLGVGTLNVTGNISTIAATTANHAVILSQLQGALIKPIRTISATTTALITDHTILCDATSGVITLNLPTAASTVGLILNIKKINNSANNITIDPNGAELIDLASTLVISTYLQAIAIQSNGTGWYVIN